MDRLSIFLTLMTGSVLTGCLIIAAFTIGWFNWTAILICAVIGFVLAWPAGYLVSRRIKRNDPAWPDRRIDAVKSPIPNPNAPEV